MDLSGIFYCIRKHRPHYHRKTLIMKILLRNVESGLFLSDVNTWTADSTQARNFYREKTAVDVSVNLRAEAVEWYYDFDDPKYNFSIPIPKPGFG